MIKRTYFFSAKVTIGDDDITHTAFIGHKSLTPQPLCVMDAIKYQLNQKYNYDGMIVTAFNRVK